MPNAYSPKTNIARRSEAYIVRIDMFTTPVATFACSASPVPTSTPGLDQHTHKKGRKRTRRKTASEFRLNASSNGGAGMGPISAIISMSAELESEPLSLVLFERWLTLRPETGEYVLLASGLGKKARSKRK